MNSNYKIVGRLEDVLKLIQFLALYNLNGAVGADVSSLPSYLGITSDHWEKVARDHPEFFINNKKDSGAILPIDKNAKVVLTVRHVIKESTGSVAPLNFEQTQKLLDTAIKLDDSWSVRDAQEQDRLRMKAALDQQHIHFETSLNDQSNKHHRQLRNQLFSVLAAACIAACGPSLLEKINGKKPLRFEPVGTIQLQVVDNAGAQPALNAFARSINQSAISTTSPPTNPPPQPLPQTNP